MTTYANITRSDGTTHALDTYPRNAEASARHARGALRIAGYRLVEQAEAGSMTVWSYRRTDPQTLHSSEATVRVWRHQEA